MSTIKNGQIFLYCHFNKIIKEPGAVSSIEPKHDKNVCRTAH